MRFLIDENVSRLVGERLRTVGFDVGFGEKGASDTVVLAQASCEGRILITEDRDFGELVVRQRLKLPGIILLELDRLSNVAEAELVTAVLLANANRLPGNLVVIESGRSRVRPLAQ